MSPPRNCLLLFLVCCRLHVVYRTLLMAHFLAVPTLELAFWLSQERICCSSPEWRRPSSCYPYKPAFRGDRRQLLVVTFNAPLDGIEDIGGDDVIPMEFPTYRGLCLEVFLQIVALKKGQKCLLYNFQPPFEGVCGQALVVTLIAFCLKRTLNNEMTVVMTPALSFSILPSYALCLYL